MTVYRGDDFQARQRPVCYCDAADGGVHLMELYEHGGASPAGRPRWRRTTVRFPLRGLVSCDLCGLACTGRALKWYCYHTRACKRATEAASRGGRCRSRLTPAGRLDAVTREDLCEVIRRPESVALGLERARGGQMGDGGENLRPGPIQECDSRRVMTEPEGGL